MPRRSKIVGSGSGLITVCRPFSRGTLSTEDTNAPLVSCQSLVRNNEGINYFRCTWFCTASPCSLRGLAHSFGLQLAFFAVKGWMRAGRSVGFLTRGLPILCRGTQPEIWTWYAAATAATTSWSSQVCAIASCAWLTFMLPSTMQSELWCTAKLRRAGRENYTFHAELDCGTLTSNPLSTTPT